jgi:hypothetical protein
MHQKHALQGMTCKKNAMREPVSTAAAATVA